MNTLTEPLITVTGPLGTGGLLTLPGLLSALGRNEVAGFPALRPHQRHAWHSFLVLLAAIALHRAGLSAPPDTEAEWRDLLRRLTPEHRNDEPWTLVVADAKQPALLQPPIPSGNIAELKNPVATPDELDMLVTAKNHDLKQTVMTAAAAEDWLFALTTLQTMEGFLGAGNYGISRMNGGFANRAAVSAAPPGGPATHWRRDLVRMLEMRGTLGGGIYPLEGGLALLWLAPWDGTTSLPQSALDPCYIEICRRIRLVHGPKGLSAYAGSSKVPRVVPMPGGVTGDPWAPLVVEKDGSAKSLTVNGSGLGYRRMVEFMFNTRAAPLQDLAVDDATEGLHILARALVRGQGKTEGYHERRVPLSRRIRSGARERASDLAAQAARDRVVLAGVMQNQVLKWALLSLFQNGPDKIKGDDKESVRKADPFLKRFDLAVDREFFPDLWAEMEQDSPDSRDEKRGEWVRKLYGIAEDLLRAAAGEAARSSRRRYRAVVRAQDRLRYAAHRNDKLDNYFTKVPTA